MALFAGTTINLPRICALHWERMRSPFLVMIRSPSLLVKCIISYPVTNTSNIMASWRARLHPLCSSANGIFTPTRFNSVAQLILFLPSSTASCHLFFHKNGTASPPSLALAHRASGQHVASYIQLCVQCHISLSTTSLASTAPWQPSCVMLLQLSIRLAPLILCSLMDPSPFKTFHVKQFLHLITTDGSMVVLRPLSLPLDHLTPGARNLSLLFVSLQPLHSHLDPPLTPPKH